MFAGKKMKRLIDRSSYNDNSFSERFVTGPTIDDCMMWIGPVNSGGYGIYNHKGNKYLAHRISYFINYGEIDRDLVIDHICMNRMCVHPEHLRQVSQGTNAIENTRTVTLNCPRGHLYDKENTIYEKNHKRCRSCKNEKGKKYRLNKKNRRDKEPPKSS